MSRTFFVYVVRIYLRFIAGIGGAVLAVYLVTDFVDRAKDYQGPNWVRDAAELYAHKAVVVAHQLAPAVLLLAAASTVATLRKRGELTAVHALAFGPRALYVPIGVTALVAALALVGFDEWVVVKSVRRSEQLTAVRFHRWGEWRLHFTPRRWFRHGDRVFYLRGGNARDGFESVSIFTFDTDFRLTERLDAERMAHVADTQWRLSGVTERTFQPDGQSRVRQVSEAVYALGAGRRAFNIQLGRPEQMRVAELRQQIQARSEGGLPTRAFVLALHNRFAYPMIGVPAALLALALALRPGRRGHLTTAFVEGMGLTVLLWAMIVLGRGLVQAERLQPSTAAWLPAVILAVAAGALLAFREGRLTWKLPRAAR